MMLRTTFSRIKRVCTVAFTPRLLRADQRCAAGKFELFFYAGLRKAQKSTKSTDDDEFEHKKEKHKDGCEYIIVPEREPKLRSDKYSDEEKNLGKGNIYTSRSPLNETHCEKCQRLIDRAFGKEDIDSIMGQQYYSQSVNIDETRREIDKAEMARIKFEEEKNIDKPIRDDRIQFGAFNRELIKEETTVEPDDLIMNESILQTIARKQRKKGGTTESDEAGESIEDSSLIPRTLNVHMTTNLDGKIPEKMENVHETEALKAENVPEIDTDFDVNAKNDYKQNFYQRRNFDVTLPHKTIVAKEAADEYVQSQGGWDDWDKPDDTKTVHAKVYKTGEDENKTDSVFTTATYIQDSSLKIDSDDILPRKATGYRPKVDNYNLEREINENKLNWNKENLEKPDHTVHATTAKEDEEQLTQKLEHIDETPLVEAQRPKIEGFNVTPRVLGDMAAVKCCCDKGMESRHPGPSSGLDVPARFDEVAKRCLDTPTNKIDEILLKEMEKLGVPISSNRDSTGRSPVIEEDLVQMDVLKKQPKRPVDKKELDLESHEFERGAAELYTKNKLYPSRYFFNETILPEHEVESSDLVKRDKEKEIAASEPVIRIHPHQVLIDPYDKKTLAYDTGEYDPNEKFPPHEFSYFYVPGAKKAQEPEAKEFKVTSLLLEKPNISASENIWNTDKSKRKPVQRRMRAPDGTRRRGGHLERMILSKKEHPLAKRIDEAYLKFNKNRKPTFREHEEKLHCEQAAKLAEKTITKGDDTISPFPSPKMSAAESTSEEKHMDPKPENETQYTYGKQNDPTPSYDQPKMYGSFNMWNPQQYHQSQTQHTQQNYAGQNQTTFEQPHLCVSNAAWCERQFEPQRQVNTQHTDTQDANAQDANTQHANTQQANTQYANTQYANPPHANTQHGSTQNAFTKGYNTSYSYNKTNMCVSDDIWDTEQINCEQSLNQVKKNDARDDTTSSYQSPNISGLDGTREQEQTDSNTAMKQAQNTYAKGIDNTTSFDKPKRSVTDAMWVKEELDPKHVLTCNETCPISPRSHMNATETRHIVDTEAIFEKEFTSTESSLPGREPIRELETREPNQPRQHAISGTKMNRTSNFIQADTVLNPLIKDQNSFPTTADGITDSISATVSPMPKLKEKVALSELLKRVRKRSQIVECKSDLKPLGVEVDPAEGKCGNKAPHCPPLAPRSPPNNPVPPPTFGLPKLKPQPRACPKRKPKTKCSSCDLDLSSGLQLGPTAYQRKAGTEADVLRTRSMADLTDEVIDRLQTLGKFLGGVLHQGKPNDFEVGALGTNRRGSKILLARDYEPWAPIPSWPSSKKGQQNECDQKNRVCTPGCKVFPPTRATHDPPCNPRPCTGFPKRTFSLLDCFTVSLGDHKVYDLGEF